MRFVHDYQADAVERSKDGAARSHDHVDLAARTSLPRIETFPFRERGMQDGDALAECRLEALRRLRR